MTSLAQTDQTGLVPVLNLSGFFPSTKYGEGDGFFLFCFVEGAKRLTPQGTNISPKNIQKWHFEDDVPFPKVGYVTSLEGNG